MRTTIIGIDCAVDPAKTGLALASYQNGKVILREAATGRRHGSAASIIVDWLRRDQGTRAIIALDAPLGWPMPLSRELSEHKAGQVVRATPDSLFRRHTDRVVHKRIGKRPLDVGADRIARTAHAALSLLGEVRQQTGLGIPLAWSPDFGETTAAIEVYPAATLAALGLPATGYKKDGSSEKGTARRARADILAGLRTTMELAENLDADSILSNADVLDAVVCVLAAADFLNGDAGPPDDDHANLARTEGWMWVRKQ